MPERKQSDNRSKLEKITGCGMVFGYVITPTLLPGLNYLMARIHTQREKGTKMPQSFHVGETRALLAVEATRFVLAAAAVADKYIVDIPGINEKLLLPALGLYVLSGLAMMGFIFWRTTSNIPQKK